MVIWIHFVCIYTRVCVCVYLKTKLMIQTELVLALVRNNCTLEMLN